ncbi:MAG: hypothetical protein WCE46_05760 [Methanoregula sp.]|jgi:hypothetical protein|uniref:hypothetical protein n=1 Tax=Methanoregula sp. TaxID=2052170 RepID=UPI003C76E2EC
MNARMPILLAGAVLFAVLAVVAAGCTGTASSPVATDAFPADPVFLRVPYCGYLPQKTKTRTGA